MYVDDGGWDCQALFMMTALMQLWSLLTQAMKYTMQSHVYVSSCTVHGSFLQAAPFVPRPCLWGVLGSPPRMIWLYRHDLGHVLSHSYHSLAGASCMGWWQRCPPRLIGAPMGKSSLSVLLSSFCPSYCIQGAPERHNFLSTVQDWSIKVSLNLSAATSGSFSTVPSIQCTMRWWIAPQCRLMWLQRSALRSNDSSLPPARACELKAFLPVRLEVVRAGVAFSRDSSLKQRWPPFLSMPFPVPAQLDIANCAMTTMKKPGANVGEALSMEFGDIYRWRSVTLVALAHRILLRCIKLGGHPQCQTDAVHSVQAGTRQWGVPVYIKGQALYVCLSVCLSAAGSCHLSRLTGPFARASCHLGLVFTGPHSWRALCAADFRGVFCSRAADFCHFRGPRCWRALCARSACWMRSSCWARSACRARRACSARVESALVGGIAAMLTITRAMPGTSAICIYGKNVIRQTCSSPLVSCKWTLYDGLSLHQIHP